MLLFEARFDIADDSFGLIVAAVDGQPARTLWNETAQHQNAAAKDRTDPEGEPPSQFGPQQIGVQQHNGCGGTESRADPETSV